MRVKNPTSQEEKTKSIGLFQGDGNWKLSSNVFDDTGVVASFYTNKNRQEYIDRLVKYDELKKSHDRLLKLLDEMQEELFTPNHEISGYHLNGNLEPIENMLENLDMEAIEEAKKLN